MNIYVYVNSSILAQSCANLFLRGSKTEVGCGGGIFIQSRWPKYSFVEYLSFALRDLNPWKHTSRGIISYTNTHTYQIWWSIYVFTQLHSRISKLTHYFLPQYKNAQPLLKHFFFAQIYKHMRHAQTQLHYYPFNTLLQHHLLFNETSDVVVINRYWYISRLNIYQYVIELFYNGYTFWEGGAGRIRA